MARDPLRPVLLIRRREVDQARAALAECLAVETRLVERIGVLDETARRSREATGAWEDGHVFLEMAALHQTTMQMRRQELEAELAAAMAGSAQARQVLAAARTAAEAVKQLIEQREAADRAETDRREQHVLDDVTRGRQVARYRVDTR